MATFDYLRTVKDLQAAGFEQNKAEAVATAIRAGQDDVAKKTEFSDLRADLTGLRADFTNLRAEFADLRAELVGMRSELAAIKWVVGLLAALNLSTLAIVVGQLVLA